MQIILSDARMDNCTIFDNISYQVTHGITMISSKLIVDRTEIYLTSAAQSKVETLFLEKLDTGFFNLYLFSDIYVANESRIFNLIATKNAVLSASAQSNVYLSKDVQIYDNKAQGDDGQTILLENTKVAKFADSKFHGNHQINIKATLASIEV